MMHKLTIRSINTCPKTIGAACSTKDFFGITDISSKEIAGAYTAKVPPSSEISDKYDPLIKSKDRLINEEKAVRVAFGRMRLDSDNTPKTHGQYEPNTTKNLYDTIDIKQMYVKENISEQFTFENVNEDWSQPNLSSQTIGNHPYKLSDIKQSIDLKNILQIFERTETVNVAINKPPLTFQFEDTTNTDVTETSSQPENQAAAAEIVSPLPPTNQSKNEIQSQHTSQSKSNHDEQLVEKSRRPKLLDEMESKYQLEGMPLEDLDPMSAEYQRRSEESNKDFEFDKILDERYDANNRNAEPVKAIDYLKQVRTKKIEPSIKRLKQRMQTTEKISSVMPRVKLDSQGFRDYTYQVPDWASFRRIDIINHIKSNIIYNNYDILAVNKPYGIASHDENRERESIDMNELMHEIALSMNLKKVHLVHRLDKTTTGVLLFATSQDRAAKLNKLFRSEEIKKTYWCITKGLPDPEEGIIDIPIGEFHVGGKLRSCPVPSSFDENLQLVKRWREARRAVTEYSILRATTRMALLEVKPKTGVKHQIRCHLGFGLNTPILGDHKYSHISRLAPQKLPLQVLNALHLRQEKVRTLPIHLHAKTVVIPGAKANGETLFINAPLPQHFVDNLKTLKLYDDEIRKTSS